MSYPLSLYFHGRWESIEAWKAMTFKELFWTIPIPYEKNYHDAVRYFEEHYLKEENVILIGNSAGVLPIIDICFKYPEKIAKVILLNPATSMMNMNTIPDSVGVKLYSGTNDYGRNIYMSWDEPKENIQVISIPWNHKFSWRDKMINKIIDWELKWNLEVESS